MTPPMKQDEMKELLDRLMAATFERDHYFDEHATPPEAGPPATPDQLMALEHHWKRRLPPSYRTLLATYDGMTKLWFGVTLLSTQRLIDDVSERESFAEPFPALWPWIFAHADDSYDALAFDPTQTRDDGEMAVVLLGDAGEDERWPSLEDFLRDHVARVEAQAEQERADRKDLPQ
jgi:SMI1 / KNR4 family (SUKH-1)